VRELGVLLNKTALEYHHVLFEAFVLGLLYEVTNGLRVQDSLLVKGSIFKDL